jgi:hypothetical protein
VILSAVIYLVKAVIGSEEAKKTESHLFHYQTTQSPQKLMRWLITFVSNGYRESGKLTLLKNQSNEPTKVKR